MVENKKLYISPEEVYDEQQMKIIIWIYKDLINEKQWSFTYKNDLIYVTSNLWPQWSVFTWTLREFATFMYKEDEKYFR